ncbi:MAG: hypothetical protein HRT36_08700 [Alphaproteobacteria bacterium]|nr:hypothetical protein [Alphaproteobacteria bacterium]
MNWSLLTARQILGWCLLLLVFVLCLVISTQPSIFAHFSPLRYLHLICLSVVITLISGEFPLILLMIFGLMIDSLHGSLLGSSSLLLVLIVPYLQLVSCSAVRFSVPRIWLMFVGFIVFYQIGQKSLQFLLRNTIIDYRAVLLDSLWAMILFPVIFAGVLYLFRRCSRNVTIPL